MGLVGGCFVSILECKEWVVCVTYIRGVVRGGGLFVPNLANLFAMSYPSIPQWLWIF